MMKYLRNLSRKLSRKLQSNPPMATPDFENVYIADHDRNRTRLIAWRVRERKHRQLAKT